MKRKGLFGKVILAGIGCTLMASSYANDNLVSDCNVVQGENSRRLCQQMNRIEYKLDRALHLLESGGYGTGGGHGQYYTPSYTCKIKISNNNYEGFGATVKDAQNDVTAFCRASGYNEDSCAQYFVGCDVDAYNESGHYKCDVKISGHTFQGLGTTKTEARTMALGLCKKSNYNNQVCYSYFQGCFAVRFK